MSRKFRIRAAWIAASLGLGCALAPSAVASVDAPAGLKATAAAASATSSPASSPAQTAGRGLQRAERQIRRCANDARREAGLPRLEGSSALAKAARRHARDMSERGYFDHTSPNGDGPGDRVKAVAPKLRLSWIGENIAAGYPDPAAACEGWMASSGHKANILSRNYTQIGGGYATGGPWGAYYVQVFAKPG
ncbi:hypothetical protein HJD18_14780 [Thermoleophilia bacterium SCSIO 60948]|nr:hypothetical protein HJD18_14780 [Thermoleophilia bacterium SCSIO 60948]